MFFIVILFSCYLISCSNSSSEKSWASHERDMSMGGATQAVDNDLETPGTMSADVTTSSNTGETTRSATGQAESGTKIEPKIIKEADIRYQVADYEKATAEIRQIVAKFKGRIANESESNTGYQVANTFVIRIDAARFDTLVVSLLKPSSYIHQKNISSTDITEEYVDIQARLHTRREVEKRYIDILKQAKSIKDILEVEQQLRMIREEIESAQGKLNYFNSRVGESTINLNVFQELEHQQAPRTGFFSKFFSAFGSGWYALLDFILGLASVWPFILVVGLLLTWLVKRRRSRAK